MIVAASLAGALLILLGLSAFSAFVREIPFIGKSPLREARNILQSFLVFSPWISWLVIGLLCFAALFLLLSLPVVMRIKRVSRAVRQIAEGDLSICVEPRGRDELSQLEADVNLMARQIGRAFELQRQAERSKDEFVMNIAHDLRTPLTSVLGYLSLMDERGALSGEAAGYARVALDKANQLSVLVNDLFDLLRMTPGAMKPELERFSIKQFLLQVQSESFPLLSAADMELRILEAPEGLFIEADGALLSRVYDNLILNAIRYSAEGKYVDLAAREGKEYIYLALTTHANPIPEEELQRVFDRLHRVEASRSGETGGAGLGLAICKGIVELHGGEIRAIHAEGGTRFVMKLPKAGDHDSTLGV